MTATDSQLLNRYAGDRSEDAFSELVRRHLDLVYSAALRQVDGDNAAAADVAQAVFTDLARKAGHLTSHTSLTGWLYTSTRFLAANARRSEERRRLREQQALAMNTLSPAPEGEPDWDRLRPVLDDSLAALSEQDREAVLWRYFERRSHAEIGTRLGISENAARMRVERALEKLRTHLTQSGIPSTSTALGLVLSRQAVLAAPAGLSDRISKNAVTQAGVVGRIPASLGRRWLVPAVLGVLILSLGSLWIPVSRSLFSSAPRGPVAQGDGLSAPGRGAGLSTANGASSASPGTPDSGNAAAAAGDSTDGEPGARTLTLLVLAADSGSPLPNIGVSGHSSGGAHGFRKEFITLRDGTCRIPYTDTDAELELVTHADGYADTRMVWNPQRGETIPARYTVRLGRPVTLGGRVLDSEGRPVSGARVGFNHEEDPGAAQRPESHEFFWIETRTGEDGRWEIRRIAEDMLRRLYGSAHHPDHVDSPLLFVGRDASAEKALRAGTHVFTLGRAVGVSGVVVDANDQPVSGAKVAVGRVGDSARREGTSDEQGAFSIQGLAPGRTLISAQASGFAATTEPLELSAATPPVRLVLRSGAELRLRVVDRTGTPVAGAYAWLNTFSPTGEPSAQAEVDLRSDAEGRVVWTEAPDTTLEFDVYAKGFMRVNGYPVRPDGKEHVVTLPPALTISGRVTDADTHEPIGKFRVITGWPPQNPAQGGGSPSWSPLDRFWLNFSGGSYRHTFEEPVIGGIENPGYVFKFEAEGYSPQITRVVAPDEGEVRLDVSLRRSEEREITISTPDGRPAARAEVALLGPGARATLSGATFEMNNSPGMVRKITDAEGRFKLPGDDALTRIVVVHESGFAEVPPAVSETSWQLLPWGRIEGRWMSGDRPVVDGELLVQAGPGPSDGLQFDFSTYRLKTDAQGRFSRDRVPPIRLNLVRLTRQDRGNGQTSWSHGRAQVVEVKAGEVTEVLIGGRGYSVTLTPVWPAGSQASSGLRVMGGIHTAIPEPPAEAAGNPEALARWSQSAEIRELALRARHFEGRMQGDRMVVDEVEPGDFMATLFVLKDAPSGSTPGSPTVQGPMPVLMGRKPIHIPAEPGSGSLELGGISLEPVAQPGSK
ncbi:MAG: sigma-70 family RNA polymerase sigma factor [Verrucomicrobiales bacterium]|nr:sigma-70 family RNA polymerase sigma factor [Verrucomicrobiales bacterium]